MRRGELVSAWRFVAKGRRVGTTRVESGRVLHQSCVGILAILTRLNGLLNIFFAVLIDSQVTL